MTHVAHVGGVQLGAGAVGQALPLLPLQGGVPLPQVGRSPWRGGGEAEQGLDRGGRTMQTAYRLERSHALIVTQQDTDVWSKHGMPPKYDKT